MVEKVDARTPTDFASLLAEEVEEEARTRANEIDKYPNILAMVKRARENHKAAIVPPFQVKGQPVPALPTDEARKLILLLRQAAKRLGVGVSAYLIKDEGDGKWSRIKETKENPYKGRSSRVRFQTADPRFFDPNKPRKPTFQRDMLQSRYDELWKEYEATVVRWNDTHDKKIKLGTKATGPTRAGRPANSH